MRYCLTLALLLAASMRSRAQVAVAGSVVDRPESVTVVPNSTYRSNGAGRLLFGDHYRDLWTTSIRVPVLALNHYAGGLRPTNRGGSMQTKALHFAGADGREYVFRSVDKDPAQSLPPDLRETFAKEIVRDLISAEHPAGALVVARLLEGVGVLHATPQLVVMPNDSVLGEYRAEFAGMLGWIEVRPTEDAEVAPGLADAARVLGSQKLLDRLATHFDERADARAYLTARLLDIFLGDWDRHAEQWRWARFGEKNADQWEPIPRDRDWALVRLDGVVWSLVRFAYPYPQFVSFDRHDPDMVWLTWNGRFLDRRFLASLDRSAWDSTAMALQRLLTDSLIESATRSLPPELFDESGAELIRTMRWRRDRLLLWSRAFYQLIADEAEVHATDASELVAVDRVDGRYTDVTIRSLNKAGAPRSRVLFQRRFDGEETREIRIFLGAGADRVVIRGARAGATLVRVVAGQETKTYVDSTSAPADNGVRIYDPDDSSRFEPSTGWRTDRTPYTPPTPKQWFAPARDWGDRWRPWPWLGYSSDIGLFVGGGPLLERYSFRTYPYAYRMTLRVGYATGVGRWRAEYDADFRRPESDIHATVLARASELDVVHYYGTGNETPNESRSAARIDQQRYELEPMLVLPLGTSSSIGVGPTVRRVLTNGDTNLFPPSLRRAYGTGTFTETGARLQVTIDSRDHITYATRGTLLSTRADWYPSVASVERAYGSIQSQLSTYVTGPGNLQPTLALRVGGQKLWGQYPFFDAAFLGGGSTLRGWAEQRFAGDASVYGNAELRVFMTKIFFLLPSDLGAFGLADAGRVFAPGEQSNVLHRGFGGGLWVAPLGKANTISFAVAHSIEGLGVYLRSGFAF